jgi:hypothetical protein
MQATGRTTWFGIDRMKLTLVAAGILVTGMTATAALSLIDISGNEADTSPAVSAAVEPVHRPTDRGVGLPWENSVLGANGGTENLEANGLPIAPIEAPDTVTVDRADQMTQYTIDGAEMSDDANWFAFPGHEGFIDECRAAC